jgi:hypothetical protein
VYLNAACSENTAKWAIGYGTQPGLEAHFSSVVTQCYFTRALLEALPPALSPPAPTADSAAGPVPPLAHRVAAVFPRVLREDRSQVPCLDWCPTPTGVCELVNVLCAFASHQSTVRSTRVLRLRWQVARDQWPLQGR